MARRMNLIILAILAVIQLTMSATPPKAQDFFKTVDGNLTKITWKHAVNNKAALDAALNSTVMMLEADVIMGTVGPAANQTKIPIMGHPPNNTSDLSLDDFLKKVYETKNITKGVKLDFKSAEAFEQSTDIIKKYNNITFPLWINADILYGPVDAAHKPPASLPEPVNNQRFFSEVKSSNLNGTLSLGWVTKFGSEYKITEGNYSQAQVDEMLKIVKDNKVGEVTFAVRAALAINSTAAMQNLVKDSKATLTIWSPETEEVDPQKLSDLIKAVGVKKVYVDVPKALFEKLDIAHSSASGFASNIAFTFITTILTASFVTRML